MTLAIILGTRPEIIKMSPLIKACEDKGLPFFVIHTGQHYSYNMDSIFFDELELPPPAYDLEAGSWSHAKQTGIIMEGVEKILERERPQVTLVEGDTNTVLGGALASAKLHIKVGHVEAGLRSFDRNMPEEINRVVTDHISDYLFAPTDIAKENLVKEGIKGKDIFVTGNTIVDALYQNLKIASKKYDVIKELGVTSKEYFLVTAHREENVDNKYKMKQIIMALEKLLEEYTLPIVFPMHPRTRERIKKYGLDIDDFDVINPVGFLEFLQLESNAKLALTDSGGVQEETCILGVPCVTMRDNTERPETINVGSNILVGTTYEKILSGIRYMLCKEGSWINPFGDGNAGNYILDSLDEY